MLTLKASVRISYQVVFFKGIRQEPIARLKQT